MKKVIIQINTNINCEEMKKLEEKFRKEYQEGLLILPHFCMATVIDDPDPFDWRIKVKVPGGEKE